MTAAFSLNSGLCLRITVLGRETQPTRGPRFLPLGKKCPRTEREGERACHLYQMGCHPGLREGQPRGYQPVAPTHPNWLWKSESTTVTTVPSTRLQVDDHPVEQNASFMEATTQTASPTMSVVELTRPIALLDRMEEENQCVLVMTALIRQLNLETTGVVLREMVTALTRRSAFPEPLYGSCPLRTSKKGNQ